MLNLSLFKSCRAVILFSCIGVVLLLGVAFLAKKSDEFVFHPRWSEEEKHQMREIDATIKEEYRNSRRFFKFEALTKHKGSLSDKVSEVISAFTNNKYEREMESCVTDTLYMTAKSGDAAYIGKNNWTLLQIACLFEKKELMLSLLRLGADPNIGASIWNGVDSSYYSFGNMLAWIITMSYLEGDKLLLIEEVVKYGADPNRAVQSDSILYAACVIPSNSEEVVLKLIEAGADTTKPFFNEDIGKRFSSLHLPFELGYQRVVRKICESGVDPNEVYDTWPLLCSVNFFSAKMLETSRILIEYGVDVNGAIPSKPGEEERCAGMTPLMKCCYDLQYSAMAREGGKEIWVENVKQFCRLLLEKGANVDAVTPYGETALMFLCGGMVKDNKIDPVNVNLARMLLDYGANPGVKCKDGKTAVEYIRNTTSDIAKHKELKPELKQEILNILPELMQK